MLVHCLFACALSALRPGSESLQGGDIVPYKDLSLTLKLPRVDLLERKESGEPGCKGEWLGRLKSSEIHVRFYLLASTDLDLVEPEDVVETWRDTMVGSKGSRAPEDEGTRFSFERMLSIGGSFGISPILAFLQMTAERKEGGQGLVLLAGGLLPKDGWLVRLDAWPAPSAEDATALVLAMEKCAAYDGKPREPKWTDEEALAYWKKNAPTSTDKKFEKPVRTEHFIVLTNSTSPGPYVKKLEAKYATIRKILPFEEVKGRRLLPILLFRTDDDFQAFYRGVYNMQVKEDVTEGSVVRNRFLATSCDNDNDYEDTVDLMRLCLYNREHVSGGGRWFQDGLREYAATKPKERAESLRAIKNGKFTPLEKLLEDGAWGKQDRKLEKRGASDEADYWGQSALWMEFLHEGPWPKESFARFVETVGSIPDGDRARVQAAIEATYGVDLSALQKKWIEYFTKH